MPAWRKILTDADTGSVQNGGTDIATGNDVYDFVVAQSYSTATGVADNADVTSSNTCNSPNVVYPAETTSTINALDITEVGVISSGQWRGDVVDPTYGGTGLTSISTLLNANVTSVSGNAGTVTNGVYTTGTQTIGGAKTFSSALAVSTDGIAGSFTSAQSSGLIVQGGGNSQDIAKFSNTSGAEKFSIDSSGHSTFSGQVLSSGGSASAPGLSFSGDPNCGLYMIYTDVVGFSTGGVNRMTLSSSAINLYQDMTIKAASGSTDFTMTGGENQHANIFIISDDGDDAGDKHKIQANIDHTLRFYHNTGSYVQNAAIDTGGNWSFDMDVDCDSLGVGTGPSGTTGEIRATNEVTAFYSDDRLKDKIGPIEKALDKVSKIEGFYYTPNDVAQELGYESKENVGLSAQSVRKVLPHAVVPAPIDDKYLTIKYEKVIPLLVNAINELSERVEYLEAKV